jgi:hypothetical protein
MPPANRSPHHGSNRSATGAIPPASNCASRRVQFSSPRDPNLDAELAFIERQREARERYRAEAS